MVSMIRTNNLGPNSIDMTWYDINTGEMLLNYHSNNGSTSVAYNTKNATTTSIREFSEISNLNLLNNGQGNLSLNNQGNKDLSYSIFNGLGIQIESGNILINESNPILLEAKPGMYYLIASTGHLYRLVK